MIENHSVSVCSNLSIMNSSDAETCFFFEGHHTLTSHEATASVVCVCAISSLFALTALLGNFIVMLVIWKTRELHTPSFALIFCLAVSDFLVGLVGQPSFVAYKVAELLENFNGYCKARIIQFFIGWITSGVSFLTLSAVCVDRLLALTLHLHYRNTITMRRVVIAMIIVWLFCFIVVIVRFWFPNWLILPVTISVLAIGVTALCTIRIFQIANRHQRQIREQNRYMVNLQNERGDAFKCKKSAITVLYVYGLMLVLYLPFIAVSAAEAFHGYTTSLKIGWDYATTIGFISSSVNPVIYSWRTKQVRRAVIEYLRKTTHGNNSAAAAESVQ